MSLNRFQFGKVTNNIDPVDQTTFPDEDPRNDYSFSHAGYSKRLPINSGESTYYVHEKTGRKLTTDQYHRETRMLDRAMDQHYGGDDE